MTERDDSDRYLKAVLWLSVVVATTLAWLAIWWLESTYGNRHGLVAPLVAAAAVAALSSWLAYELLRARDPNRR